MTEVDMRESGNTAFNVAASIKMRKFPIQGTGEEGEKILQCGRIYKDAEIPAFNGVGSYRFTPFNVAASIKMRK